MSKAFGFWTLGALAVVGGCGVILGGCGASALEQHAQASILLNVAAHAAHDTMMEAREARANDALELVSNGEQARRAVSDVREDFDRPIALYDAMREIVDGYQVIVAKAFSDGIDFDAETALGMLLRAWDLYEAWREALGSLGVELPAPPDLGLIGGGS